MESVGVISNSIFLAREGISIQIQSGDPIPMGSVVMFELKEKTYYFKIGGHSISADRFMIMAASETGNSRSPGLRMVKDLDIRELMGLDVYLVEDPELINKIAQQSHWT